MTSDLDTWQAGSLDTGSHSKVKGQGHRRKNIAKVTGATSSDACYCWQEQ